MLASEAEVPKEFRVDVMLRPDEDFRKEVFAPGIMRLRLPDFVEVGDDSAQNRPSSDAAALFNEGAAGKFWLC